MDKQVSTRSGSGKSGEGLSLEDLFGIFPDDRAAMEWFEKSMWPDGRKYPRCGYAHTCVAWWGWPASDCWA